MHFILISNIELTRPIMDQSLPVLENRIQPNLLPYSKESEPYIETCTIFSEISLIAFIQYGVVCSVFSVWYG